jgi:hypothetical protein
LLEELLDAALGDGALAGGEEGIPMRGPDPDIGLEELPGILAQGLDPGIAVLQAGDADLVPVKVHVFDLEERRFSSPRP